MLFKGDSVMIHSGMYTSYIAVFVKHSECGKFAYVDLDLSPTPKIKRIRLKAENVSRYHHT